MSTDGQWRTRALCVQTDPDLFFPQPGDKQATAAAKEICAACPVRVACLEAALAEEGGRTAASRFGIRGGKTHSQRYHLYSRARKLRRTAA
ncbi:WhiB family transcriptional regulator [Streptomyces sp. NPDC057620]|uniref:WhiB family transcriptional regulator n=1 Tax=Streptomyces sp. NPDC057620 TaxID=3346185 RepID=UPI00368E768A